MFSINFIKNLINNQIHFQKNKKNDILQVTKLKSKFNNFYLECVLEFDKNGEKIIHEYLYIFENFIVEKFSIKVLKVYGLLGDEKIILNHHDLENQNIFFFSSSFKNLNNFIFKSFISIDNTISNITESYENIDKKIIPIEKIPNIEKKNIFILKNFLLKQKIKNIYNILKIIEKKNSSIFFLQIEKIKEKNI